MQTTAERTRANALPHDPNWCGHAMVDLQEWHCAACGQQVTAGTRAELENASPLAPEGSVWVVQTDAQIAVADDREYGYLCAVMGAFTDRRKAQAMVEEEYEELGKTIRWTQGAFNHRIFEGWAAPDEYGTINGFRIQLEWIDPKLGTEPAT